jgi:hypothetical protein
MIQLTSKAGIAQGKQKTVYKYIADFRNFAHLLPTEQLKNTRVTEESVEFVLDGFGHVGLAIAEKRPFHQLIVKAMEGTAGDFTFWINIEEASGNTSRTTIIFEANLNMFIEMMARAPLQRFLDLMIDKLSELDFQDTDN